MPTILRVGPYRFYFYPADRNEPRHVHVVSGKKEAKFWLDPFPIPAYNHGFNGSDLRKIQGVIWVNLGRLRGDWDAFFAP